MGTLTPPILYSFRRCPYAMRARMALLQANVRCELREVVLKEKPQALLDSSSKGSVPVLVVSEQQVLEQSIEVMRWALQQSDPDAWLSTWDDHANALIEENDGHFKHYLDRYKYHVGYPEHPPAYYRDEATSFLHKLEEHLSTMNGTALSDNTQYGFADVAIFPFIRQFANVDKDWFMTAPFPLLQAWYQRFEQLPLFQLCMKKYAQWQPSQTPVYFPA